MIIYCKLLCFRWTHLAGLAAVIYLTTKLIFPAWHIRFSVVLIWVTLCYVPRQRDTCLLVKQNIYCWIDIWSWNMMDVFVMGFKWPSPSMAWIDNPSYWYDFIVCYCDRRRLILQLGSLGGQHELQIISKWDVASSLL